MKAKTSIEPPVLLKTILDIFFWLMVIGLFASAIFISAAIFFDFPVDAKINEYEITEFSIPVIIGLILKALIGISFIYIVYLLRKVIRSFKRNKLFSDLQITGFNLIGRLIIFTAIANVILDFLLKFFLEDRLEISFEVFSYHSVWFTIALGLFFILLSQSFRYAKQLQEENDFTV